MENLFNEFEGISPKAWKQKIQVDLNGADYNKTLLWKTEEDITVRPFYTKEDRTYQEIKPPNDSFSVCQTIFIDNEIIANSLAIEALKHGATSIYFSSNKTFNYKKVLKNIEIEYVKIYFNFSFLDSDFVQKISKVYPHENIYFNIDIIGNLAKTGNWFKNLKNDHEQLKKIVNYTKNAIQIDTSIYQNAGANIVQQLAYGLAHANEYLNYFDGKIAHKIHFKFAVGNNYFFEISKFRAFRLLWTSLLNEYKIQNTEIHIFAQPTLRNKTLYNYNVNMLRTTSECMSAILGGANTISNIPYDYIFRKSNKFSEHVSRNQLLILQEESFFSEAQSFVDGTYYIENITQQLAEKALDIFKLIEQGGGFLKQLKAGIIQRKIKESANKEQIKFDNGTLVLIGTNKIQNKQDKIKNHLELYPFVKSRLEKTLIQPIIQQRLAEKSEKDRLSHE